MTGAVNSARCTDWLIYATREAHLPLSISSMAKGLASESRIGNGLRNLLKNPEIQ
jgi:hypothetical protein